jgi:hypothetical protein
MSLLSAAQYRSYAGLTPTDPPTDAEIERALERNEILVESYLNRPLGYGRWKDKVIWIDTPSIILAAYPVESINDIQTDQGAVDGTGMVLNNDTGELWHLGRLFGRKNALIEYTGGWKTMPADIALVIFTLAEAVLSGKGGGAAALQQAPVKQETVYGVGSTTYDTSLLVAGGDDGQSGAFPELGPYVAVLDRYKDRGWVA